MFLLHLILRGLCWKVDESKKNFWLFFDYFILNYKVLPFRKNVTLRHCYKLTISMIYIEAITPVFFIHFFDNTSSPFVHVFHGTNHAYLKRKKNISKKNVDKNFFYQFEFEMTLIWLLHYSALYIYFVFQNRKFLELLITVGDVFLRHLWSSWLAQFPSNHVP